MSRQRAQNLAEVSPSPDFRVAMSTLAPIVNAKADTVLQSTDCHYRTFDNIGSIDIFDELTPHLDKKCDHMSQSTIVNE